MADRKRVTAPEFLAKKARGERLVMVTAYDFPSARLADEAGVDAILVGDSLGMVVLGHQTTVPVTVDDMEHHVRAVSRAETLALVVADLPFLSYQGSDAEAFRNAARLLQAGASAVKVEGAGTVCSLVRRLTESGVPVMGHLGLTPQSVLGMGGFRIQARTSEAAKRLMDDARSLEEAGAFGLVLEGVPAEVARAVTAAIGIPTIGIGAGVGCNGQVQVWHDLLGLAGDFKPRHAKQYVDAGAMIRDAIARYAAEVRAGNFPTEAETVHAPELEDAEKWK